MKTTFSNASTVATAGFMPMMMVLVLGSMATVTAAPWFRDRIPNGFSVPNPNIPGSIWAGVGHLAVGGGESLGSNTLVVVLTFQTDTPTHTTTGVATPHI